MPKVDIITAGPLPAKAERSLTEQFESHRFMQASEADGVLSAFGSVVRGVARGGHFTLDAATLRRMPKLEIIANFGVGYDGIDLPYAAEHGILVTNTPDVLTEEVADTALGLLLMTVRELSAAERHLRMGKWATQGGYRLSPATLRDRTVGIVGLGRIGLAVARRLDAMKVPVAYYGRRKQESVPYTYYSDLIKMAEDVDILLAILPGGPETKNTIGKAVFEALGAGGIFINIGRGSAVDEPAMIEALQRGTIFSAGLDVFVDEPNVPAALIAMENVVLTPHVGSGSVYTRDAMGQLVVDNLVSWFEQGKPVTPVPETPWPRK